MADDTNATKRRNLDSSAMKRREREAHALRENLMRRKARVEPEVAVDPEKPPRRKP